MGGGGGAREYLMGGGGGWLGGGYVEGVLWGWFEGHIMVEGGGSER